MFFFSRFFNQIYFVYLEPAVPAGTEEDTGQQDEEEILKVEEHAVVLALRDTYMPGLDSSDAVMFATLLADLFPNAQVPMIFDTFGAEGSKMRMNEQVSNLEEIPVLPKPPGDFERDNLEGKKHVDKTIIYGNTNFNINLPLYYQFSHDVTSAILVAQNDKKAAVSVSKSIMRNMNSYLTKTLSFLQITLRSC